MNNPELAVMLSHRTRRSLPLLWSGHSTRYTHPRSRRQPEKEKISFFAASFSLSDGGDLCDTTYGLTVKGTYALQTTIMVKKMLHSVTCSYSGSSCCYGYRSFAGLDSFDSFSVVFSSEDRRTSNKGIRSSFNDLVGVFGTDSAINLDPGVHSLLFA